MNNEWWMKKDSDKTETGRTYGKEPRTPDEPSGPLTWQNSKSLIHWFIFKNDSTLIYWHTHHRQDQPTLERNKSGILVLVPMGGSVTTLFLLLLLLWTFVRWEETWKGENDKRDSTEEDRDRRRWMMRRQTTESNCYNFYSFTHSFSLNYTLNFIL